MVHPALASQQHHDNGHVAPAPERHDGRVLDEATSTGGRLDGHQLIDGCGGRRGREPEDIAVEGWAVRDPEGRPVPNGQPNLDHRVIAFVRDLDLIDDGPGRRGRTRIETHPTWRRASGLPPELPAEVCDWLLDLLRWWELRWDGATGLLAGPGALL